MANIAQIANVLQSMILTDGDQMVLTPTYHVFKMYNVHQDATHLPLEIACDSMTVRDNRVVPMISATASKDQNGKVHISLSNIDNSKSQEVTINLANMKAKNVTGEMLTSKSVDDYNSFENPNKVAVQPFTDAKIKKDQLVVKMQPNSIVTLEVL